MQHYFESSVFLNKEENAMWLLVVGAGIAVVILLFIGLSVIGLITPNPGDSDSTGTGIVRRG
jgi:hypothetical protein